MMPEAIHAYCEPDQRSFMDRVWSRLGFGTRRHPDMHDLDDEPGFAPAHLSTTTLIYWDWRDRLRLLISGKVMVDLSTKTDVVVHRAISRSSVGVLPPNYPMQTP